DELHGWLPAVTQCQGAQPDDVLSGALLPAGAGALHPDFKQALAARLDGAATHWTTLLSRRRVVHLVQMILQVGDRLMDGPSVSDVDMAAPRGPEFLQDLARGL